MALTREEWREVPGFPSFIASSEGRVARIRGYHCKNGYQYVQTEEAGQVTVHSLVALAFLGERPDDRPTVNHKDGDKKNNHPANLEYVSYGDNHRHAYRTGLRKPVGPHKLTGNNREQARALYRQGISASELARRFGMSRSGMLAAVREVV